MKTKTLTMMIVLLISGIVVSGLAFAANGSDSDFTLPYPVTESLTREELVFLTASELAERIRGKKITSEDVVKAYIEQIATYNLKINAIVTLNEESAIQRAKKADAALENGEIWGPLHGVPITIKDNLAVKGVKTTCGYEPLADFVSDKSAAVVKRLNDAGAIILGITNMPALGLDAQTFNDLYGTTNNPWDLTKTPGGSSGGCAAAVAAGFTPLSIGNDIGGSIRVPAAFSGVYGLKPTDHLVSKAGLLPPPEDYRSLRHLLSIGPLTRSVEDLRLALSIIGGADNIDTDVPVVSFDVPEKKAIGSLKIGWAESFGDVYITKEIKTVFKGFINRLSKNGLNVEKRTFDIDYIVARQTFFDIFGQETLVHESFFDRMLFSSPPFQKVFPLSLRNYLKTMDRRETIIQNVETFLAKQDVWIIPTAPIAAHNHRKPDGNYGPFNNYDEPLKYEGKAIDVGSLTTLFNLTGNPVVAMPIGFTKEGLPVGIQIVGHRWKDMELLNVAQQLAELIEETKMPYKENMKKLDDL